MVMNKYIEEQLLKRFRLLGEMLGYTKSSKRSFGCVSEIYIINKHAIQIETDWRENNLFMYLVYLKDGKLPPQNTIYNYDDGHFCRVFIENIYCVKRPYVKDTNQRYSEEYLIHCFDFYESLLTNNPEKVISIQNTW